jgi:hypothetical protein
MNSSQAIICDSFDSPARVSWEKNIDDDDDDDDDCGELV